MMEVLNTSSNQTTVVLSDLGLRIAPGESIKIPLERLVGSEDFIKALSRRVLGVRFTAGEAANNPLFTTQIRESLALGRADVTSVKKFELQPVQFGAKRVVNSIEVERAGILHKEPDSRALKEDKIVSTNVTIQDILLELPVPTVSPLFKVDQDEISELLQQYLLQAVFVYVEETNL